MQTLIQDNTSNMIQTNNIDYLSQNIQPNIGLNDIKPSLQEEKQKQQIKNNFLENLKKIREQNKNEEEEIEKQKQQQQEEDIKKEKIVFENYKKQSQLNEIPSKEIDQQKDQEIQQIQNKFDVQQQQDENLQDMKGEDSIFNCSVNFLRRSKSPILKTKKKFLPTEIKYQQLNAQRKQLENGQINFLRRTKIMCKTNGKTQLINKKPPQKPLEEMSQQKNEKKIEKPVQEEQQLKNRKRKQVNPPEQEEFKYEKETNEIMKTKKKVKIEIIDSTDIIIEEFKSEMVEKNSIPNKNQVTNSNTNKQLQLQQQRKMDTIAAKEVQNEQKQTTQTQLKEKKQTKIDEICQNNKQSKDNAIKQIDVPDQKHNNKNIPQHNEKDNKEKPKLDNNIKKSEQNDQKNSKVAQMKQNDQTKVIEQRNFKQEDVQINKSQITSTQQLEIPQVPQSVQQKNSRELKSNKQLDKQILNDHKTTDKDRERTRDFKNNSDKFVKQQDNQEKRDQLMQKKQKSVEVIVLSSEKIEYIEEETTSCIKQKSDKVKESSKFKMEVKTNKDQNTNQKEKNNKEEKDNREEQKQKDDKKQIDNKNQIDEKQNKEDRSSRYEKRNRDKVNRDEKINNDEKIKRETKSENPIRNEKMHNEEQHTQKELKSILKKPKDKDEKIATQTTEKNKKKEVSNDNKSKVSKSLEQSKQIPKQEFYVIDNEDTQNEMENEEDQTQNAYNQLFSSTPANNNKSSKKIISKTQQLKKNSKNLDEHTTDEDQKQKNKKSYNIIRKGSQPLQNQGKKSTQNTSERHINEKPIKIIDEPSVQYYDDRQINLIEDRAKNIYEKMQRSNIFNDRANQFYSNNIPMQQYQNNRFYNGYNNPTHPILIERNLDLLYQNSQQYPQFIPPRPSMYQNEFKNINYPQQDDYYQEEPISKQQSEYAKISNSKRQQDQIEDNLVFNVLNCVRESDRGFVSQMFSERNKKYKAKQAK